MNTIHWIILGCVGLFVVLLFVRASFALSFARMAVLLSTGAIMLAPFIWRVCSVFKDPQVLMQ